LQGAQPQDEPCRPGVGVGREPLGGLRRGAGERHVGAI
jgi:hypothetical protein